jgi:hypothetical protein
MNSSKLRKILNNAEKRRQSDEKDFRNEVTPVQIHFFDNDPLTQRLLNEYTDFVFGKTGFDKIQEIVDKTQGKEALWLYIQHKTREMLDSESENRKAGKEIK